MRSGWRASARTPCWSASAARRCCLARGAAAQRAHCEQGAWLLGLWCLSELGPGHAAATCLKNSTRDARSGALVPRCTRILGKQHTPSNTCCFLCTCRCDREDRHRGLCNHRATIPGPAACRSLRAQQQEQDDEQDTSSMDQGEHCRQAPGWAQPPHLSKGGTQLGAVRPVAACAQRAGRTWWIGAVWLAGMQEPPCCCFADCAGEVAAYSDVLMQCVEAQQASGGHSHTCQAPCAQGDEREVDSAVHTGECAGHPVSAGVLLACLPAMPRACALTHPAKLYCVVCSCTDNTSHRVHLPNLNLQVACRVARTSTSGAQHTRSRRPQQQQQPWQPSSAAAAAKTTCSGLATQGSWLRPSCSASHLLTSPV